jgi:hypothetical protein
VIYDRLTSFLAHEERSDVSKVTSTEFLSEKGAEIPGEVGRGREP